MAGDQVVVLPPEVWLYVFQHTAHVPGALVPEIYAHASHIGPFYTRTCHAALREALVTIRVLVRVCKQWWHLAIPYLYRSVYVGRARCLSSLSNTLLRSIAGNHTIVGPRPLGEFTERLDIAIRDHAENADAEFDSLAALISCMPHLAIVSFAIASNYGVISDLPNNILDALQHSAASLRVLDWSSARLEPSASRIVGLLAKCTRLRVLHCPRLVWSKGLEHGGLPLGLTTLRVHALIPMQIATAYNYLPDFDFNTVRRPGPSALQELILDLNRDLYYWKDLLEVYRDQLVSVQFYAPGLLSINIDGHLQLLAKTCPRLRRLTITSDQFSSFSRPHLVFPSIVFLGLRVTKTQSRKLDFEMLFMFLEELSTSVPSLQVVQLLNEHNVQCLLKTHTKYAVHALQPFMEGTPFRVEDGEGVSLTDRLNALGYL